MPFDVASKVVRVASRVRIAGAFSHGDSRGQRGFGKPVVVSELRLLREVHGIPASYAFW